MGNLAPKIFQNVMQEKFDTETKPEYIVSQLTPLLKKAKKIDHLDKLTFIVSDAIKQIPKIDSTKLKNDIYDLLK